MKMLEAMQRVFEGAVEFRQAVDGVNEVAETPDTKFVYRYNVRNRTLYIASMETRKGSERQGFASEVLKAVLARYPDAKRLRPTNDNLSPSGLAFLFSFADRNGFVAYERRGGSAEIVLEAGRKVFEAHDYAALSDADKAKFQQLATLQRGYPEGAMLAAQRFMSGGVYPHALEHVGDLTHRLAESPELMKGEYAKTKVVNAVKWLKAPYGFEREMEENIDSSAEYRGVDKDEFRKQYYALGQTYADEHKKLPVYNEIQWLAREAAVALGERRFDECLKYLERMEGFMTNGTWDQEVLSATIRGDDGRLKEYDREQAD